VGGEPLLDLCYEEDARADVDFNIVMNGEGRFIELQGTAEADPFDRVLLNRLLDLAARGIGDLLRAQREALEP
jgi:ribonuclease PH